MILAIKGYSKQVIILIIITIGQELSAAVYTFKAILFMTKLLSMTTKMIGVERERERD